jgi:hypothetical protein
MNRISLQDVKDTHPFHPHIFSEIVFLDTHNPLSVVLFLSKIMIFSYSEVQYGLEGTTILNQS